MPGLRTISGAPVGTLSGSPVRMLAADGVTWLTLTAVPKRTNLVLNPRAAVTASPATGWDFNPGGGTAAVTRGVEGATTFARVTWSAAATNALSGIYSGIPDSTSTSVTAAVPGQVYSATFRARCSRAQRLQVRLYFYNSTTQLTVFGGDTVVVAANTWTTFKIENCVAPAGADRLIVLCYNATGTGYVAWAVGDTLDMTEVIVEQGATVGPFFDGATPTDVDYRYVWSSTPNASTSLALP